MSLFSPEEHNSGIFGEREAVVPPSGSGQDRAPCSALEMADLHDEFIEQLGASASAGYENQSLPSDSGRTQVPDVPKISATLRVLEIRRHREIADEVAALVDNGLRALSGISNGASSLSEFLTRTEVDIRHLENAEAENIRLRQTSAHLLRQNAEMKVKLARQLDEIDVLASLKGKLRELISCAKREIASQVEQTQSREFRLASQEAVIARLREDKARLQKALESGEDRAAAREHSRSEDEIRLANDARSVDSNIEFDPAQDAYECYSAERNECLAQLESLVGALKTEIHKREMSSASWRQLRTFGDKPAELVNPNAIRS